VHCGRAAEKRLQGKAGWKVEPQEGTSNFQARTDFQQMQSNGIELSLSELGSLQKVFAQGMHENIGCRMNEQSERIGSLVMAAGPVKNTAPKG